MAVGLVVGLCRKNRGGWVKPTGACKCISSGILCTLQKRGENGIIHKWLDHDTCTWLAFSPLKNSGVDD